MKASFLSYFMILLVSTYGYLIPRSIRATRNNVGSLRSAVVEGLQDRGPQVEFLIDLWDNIAYPREDYEKQFRLNEYNLTRRTIDPVLKHFQVCKDCAADDSILIATQDDDNNDMIVLTNGNFKILSDDPEDEQEVWTDYGDDTGLSTHDPSDDVFRHEKDDEKVLEITKTWVKKVIADFNVCPFTLDPHRAGIPVGGVRYTIDRSVAPEAAFLAFWKEVKEVLLTAERQISTVLLIFPELDLFGNYELFEVFCESLNDGLSCASLGMEDTIQLVFFHPKYQFRDGQARLSSDQGAANFARRGPWPMINILRTNQVRAAQKGIPTGQVYRQNEDRLNAIGTQALQDMLTRLDWSHLPAISASEKAENIKRSIERAKELELAEAQLSAPAACPFHLEEPQVPEIPESVPNSRGSSLKQFYRLLGGERVRVSSGEAMTVADYRGFAQEVMRWLAVN